MACNASAPELRAAYDSYSDQGFEVLSVSNQEGDAEVAEFIEIHDLTYPMLMDRTGETSATYEVTSTPTSRRDRRDSWLPSGPPHDRGVVAAQHRDLQLLIEGWATACFPRATRRDPPALGLPPAWRYPPESGGSGWSDSECVA